MMGRKSIFILILSGFCLFAQSPEGFNPASAFNELQASQQALIDETGARKMSVKKIDSVAIKAGKRQQVVTKKLEKVNQHTSNQPHSLTSLAAREDIAAQFADHLLSSDDKNQVDSTKRGNYKKQAFPKGRKGARIIKTRK